MSGMNFDTSDDAYCASLIDAFSRIFPDLTIVGGADEPYYQAPKTGQQGIIYFRDNYPRSLLHELSHYCLAGARRRTLDDFGFWYTPCGRSAAEQQRFEWVEARPQGLEKALCEVVGLKFSPSLDDFSGRPPSAAFLSALQEAYEEMITTPSATAKLALSGLREHFRLPECVS